MDSLSKSPKPSKLLSVFGLRPGEGRLAAVMIFYSAAISVAIMVGYRGVATGLFLSKLPPAAIPYLYILPAISVSLTILAYNQVASRISMRSLVLGSLALIFGITLLFRVLLSTEYGDSFVVLAGLYVFMEAVFNLLTLQYWALAGQLYDPRAAKRLFGLFAVTGMIAGLIAATLLGPLGETIGVPNLLILAALGVAAAWGYTRLLLNRYVSGQAGHTEHGDEHGDTDSGETLSTRQIITSIWKVPLLLAIAGLTILVSPLYTMGDYEFNLALQETFGHDEQSLVAYLGNFLGLASLAAIATQLYIGPLVIKRFGLLPTLLFYPVSTGLVAIFSLWVGGGLLAASGLEACILVFRLTLYETGVHILYLPIAANLRMRAKELLWVAHALASGVVGLVFLAVQAVIPVPYVFWSVPLIIMAAIGVWLVSWTRKQYVSALTENIRRRQFDLSASTLDVTDETTVQVLVNTLRQSDELQVLQALELIVSAPGVDWTPYVAPLFSHPSPDVRVQALRYLGSDANTESSGSTAQVRLIEPLLDAPEESVRAAAVEVFCRIGGAQAATRVAPLLTDSSLKVRAAVITGLAQHGDMSKAAEALRGLLNNQEPQARVEGLRVLGKFVGMGHGSLLQNLDNTIISLLDDHDSQVRAEAERVAGMLGNPAIVPKLISKLKDGATAAVAIEALAYYGSTCVEELGQRLENSNEDQEVRRQIPKVLARIGDDRSAQLLLARLSESDENVRAEIYKAIRQLSLQKETFKPAPDLLLKAAMQEVQGCYTLFVLREDINAKGQDPLLNEAITLRIRRTLQGIFDLLFIMRKGQDVEHLRQALDLDGSEGSHGGAKRAQALELLDNLAEGKLRELLVPFFEASPDQIVALAKKHYAMERKPLNTRLEELVASTDPWMQASAFWRIGYNGGSSDPRLRSLLTEGAASPDALVRETAATVERKLSKVQTSYSETQNGSETLDPGLSTLGEKTSMPVSTIERVLVLKRVDLFADVSAEELISVAGLAKEVSFNAGETFLHQGEIADCLYVTVDGDTAIHIEGAGEVAVRHAPTVLGEMAIILRQPRSATCTARTDILALEIDSAPFQQLLGEKPTLALSVIKVLAERLDSAQRQAV